MISNTSNIHDSLQFQQEEYIATAHQAFLAWKSVPIDEKSEKVLNLAICLQKNKEMLSASITTAMGKSPEESVREIKRSIDACEKFPALAKQYLADDIVATEYQKSFICYQPMGTVLGVMPWNFPVWQVIRFAIPVLLAGNTVLLKHDPLVFECSELLESLFLEAGFPKGVFQHFPAPIESVENVIWDSRVRGVSLTGSEEAGRAVAKVAGESLTKVVLELGGSDPFIVLEDADLELAAKNACAARFMNAGQICVSAKRIFVEDSVSKKFVALLLKEIELIADSLAPLARVDICDTLERQVKESVAMGATIVMGGKRSLENPLAFEATLLENVASNMPVFSEEVFGPVASVKRFSTIEELVQMANDSLYGLGASIWTGNIEQGEALGLQLESGMTFVNSVVKGDFRLPFGGCKNSGFGRELGEVGFREFTNIKTVVVA